MKESPDQQLLSCADFARLLNCSTRHIRRLVDRGACPEPLRIGALIRWRRAEILGWIEASCPDVQKSRADS